LSILTLFVLFLLPKFLPLHLVLACLLLISELTLVPLDILLPLHLLLPKLLLMPQDLLLLSLLHFIVLPLLSLLFLSLLYLFLQSHLSLMHFFLLALVHFLLLPHLLMAVLHRALTSISLALKSLLIHSLSRDHPLTVVTPGRWHIDLHLWSILGWRLAPLIGELVVDLILSTLYILTSHLVPGNEPSLLGLYIA
jgi:hypothetical protein